MTRDRTQRPTPPTQAGPLRRAFHTLIATAGWIVFGYWWWLVLGRLDPVHVRWTLVFIALTLALSVLLTAAWAFHNLRIFRLRGPRTQVPRTTYEFKRDRLGRPIVFADRRELLEKAQVVQIGLEHEGKTYRAFERVAASFTRSHPPAAAGTTVPVPQPFTTRTERVPVAPPARPIETDEPR
jgi:hypothetical protein